MDGKRSGITILLAEDDDDQYRLIREVFEEARLFHELLRFKNGGDLIDYLLARGAYQDRVMDKSLPCIILLDRNMPIVDGTQTLKDIKSHPLLRKLPVIMLTSSERPEHVVEAYDLGANSFISKPFTLDGFMQVVNALKLYWVDIVRLPEPLDLPGRGVGDAVRKAEAGATTAPVQSRVPSPSH